MNTEIRNSFLMRTELLKNFLPLWRVLQWWQHLSIHIATDIRHLANITKFPSELSNIHYWLFNDAVSTSKRYTVWNKMARWLWMVRAYLERGGHGVLSFRYWVKQRKAPSVRIADSPSDIRHGFLLNIYELRFATSYWWINSVWCRLLGYGIV
jgi:hypothetical protein